MKKWISRRNFLKATGISAVAAGLTACGGSSSSTSSSTASGSAAASGEMPKVVMYYPLSSVQPDQEKVSKAIHDYVADKKGIDLQLEVVPNSSYDNQLNLVMAGSEQIDLALIWGRNVSSFVAKGALLPLDENGQNEDGEVYLYRYAVGPNGAPQLDNIETDEEYEIVSDAFDELLDSMEYDEIVSEDELN